MSAVESLQKGAYHIANNKVEYNPQRKSNFTLIVNGLDDIKRVGAADDDRRNVIKDAQNQIILALKSSDVPKVAIGKSEIKRGNSTIKFAGKPTFDDITFVAYDYMGSDVKDTLLAWQNLAYNTRYDYIGNASAYKKSAQLIEYTPNAEMVRYWDITGAWLSNVEADSFEVDDDGVVTVKATMVFDWAEMHLPDDYTV